MASESYINLHKDEETIRLTVLTNICRMMVVRGYMDKKKYALTPESAKRPGPISQTSDSDPIDNKLFLPYIEKRTDNSVYTIPLDIDYKDERDNKKKGDVPEFDGSMLVIKLIPQKVTDIENSPLFNEFNKTYAKYHRIIVFDGMSDKAYNSVRRRKNLEAFDRDGLMIDLMSYIASPISCEIVTEDDTKHIINPKIAKIHENDPLARYHSAKKGQILRIVRASINNSTEVAYRRVTDPKPIFK